jgi:hypothetical protein
MEQSAITEEPPVAVLGVFDLCTIGTWTQVTTPNVKSRTKGRSLSNEEGT